MKSKRAIYRKCKRWAPRSSRGERRFLSWVTFLLSARPLTQRRGVDSADRRLACAIGENPPIQWCRCIRLRSMHPTINQQQTTDLEITAPHGLTVGSISGRRTTKRWLFGYRSGDGCHTGSSPAQAGQAVAKRMVVPRGTFLLSARPLTQILRKICASPKGEGSIVRIVGWLAPSAKIHQSNGAGAFACVQCTLLSTNNKRPISRLPLPTA